MHTDTPRRNSYSIHSTEHTPVRQSLCVVCVHEHICVVRIYCISSHAQYIKRLMASIYISHKHTGYRAPRLYIQNSNHSSGMAHARREGPQRADPREAVSICTSPPARTHAQPSRSPTGGGPSHEINCKYVPRARPEPSRSLSLGASRRRKGTNAVLLTASRRATSSRRGRRRSGSSCCSCRRQKPPCSSRCS